MNKIIKKGTQKSDSFFSAKIKSILWIVVGAPDWIAQGVLGFGLIKFWVLEFNVLLKRTLWAIAFFASLHAADISSFDFFCGPSESFFTFWLFAADVVFEVLCFFLLTTRITSSLPILTHKSYLLWQSCLNCMESRDAVRYIFLYSS